MKGNKKILLLCTAYCLLLLVMFILPAYSTTGYSIISNTLSQLGAQCTQNAWVMNITFMSLSIGSITAGWRYFESYAFHRLFLVLFCISLTLAALFNHAPVITNIQYNIPEDGWHSYFIFTTWLTFVILTVSTAYILDKHRERLLAASAGASVIILSVLMTEADQVAGVWQRLSFLISFGWLINTFKTKKS